MQDRPGTSADVLPRFSRRGRVKMIVPAAFTEAGTVLVFTVDPFPVTHSPTPRFVRLCSGSLVVYGPARHPHFYRLAVTASSFWGQPIS
jgi:hypothetical protein